MGEWLSTCLQNKLYRKVTWVQIPPFAPNLRKIMKNGWYKACYKDVPTDDYWTPNNEIVYIENDIEIKRLNECYHKIDNIKSSISDNHFCEYKEILEEVNVNSNIWNLKCRE